MPVPTRAEIMPSSVAVCLILLEQDLHQTLEFTIWGFQQAPVLWLEVLLLGIQAQVLMLVQQMFLSAEPPP